MTINRPKTKTVELRIIECGQCFKLETDERIYFKTQDRTENGNFLCVSLATGATGWLPYDLDVVPVNTELNVIEEG